MNRRTSILSGVFAAAAVGLAQPAGAVLITGTGNSLISYSFSSLQGGVTLSGAVNVDVTQFNTATNTVTLSVTLSNTTPIATAGTNLWTHWGFGSDPDVISVGFSDAADGGMNAADISNFPALGLIEACSTSGTNCAGGAGGGIGENSSDAFIMTLRYSSIAGGVTLDPFGVKFQAVGQAGGSAEFYTPPGSPPPPPPPPPGGNIPEPGSLALVGLGALGLGAFRRRKKLFDPNLGEK